MNLEIYLQRFNVVGTNLFGRAQVIFYYDGGRIIPYYSIIFNSLENKDKCIKCGEYPLKVTYSPKFKKQLILVDNVAGRSGIRIHPFNYGYESKGCITFGIPSTDSLMLCNTTFHCEFLQRLVSIAKSAKLIVSSSINL